ncbi:hypothetical protein NDU88_001449 [Pleurodeles waltl]|uniref:Uncharacterized protein n=1 Tax=Pleurodeles waltl TaxID=8319 RepID=A0AAV7P3S9_PLEWA|nr:hypothetical protein NDU88_001449 [Pleurodeles waltl]
MRSGKVWFKGEPVCTRNEAGRNWTWLFIVTSEAGCRWDLAATGDSAATGSSVLRPQRRARVRGTLPAMTCDVAAGGDEEDGRCPAPQGHGLRPALRRDLDSSEGGLCRPKVEGVEGAAAGGAHNWW